MGKEMIVDKRHLRSIRTKEKILKAAKGVFLQEGYQKTTISQIIKVAGIGYGTAYVHFDGKEDILNVLMDYVMKEFYKIAEMDFAPVTKEEAIRIIGSQAYAFLQLAEQERDILRVFDQAIGMTEVAANKWGEIRKQFILRIEQDILHSKQAGLTKTGLDYELVARSWFYLNEMYLWEIVRNNEPHSVEDIAKTITDIYVSGLYKI